jgi:small GTP-binding protein
MWSVSMKILSDQQDALLQEERETLADLKAILSHFGMAPEDEQALEKSIQQADDFFMLVVVGEFNAGKSVLINALLGERLLKAGVTPTTTRINVVRYGEQTQRTAFEENITLFYAPTPLLREISIVDTPGTNAIIREHEAITSQFVPRSDLVLFVTSADRPFTETERAFLELIHSWGKKIVIVLNKIDLLQTQEELDQVLDFIRENATPLLGFSPEIFPVSARQALEAKLGQPNLWSQSRFEALEEYIKNTLDETSRLKLKLASPLGVGLKLAEQYEAIAAARLAVLQEDLSLLGNLEQQMTHFESEMLSDFQFRMTDIEKVLYQMEQRGQDFFNEKMKLLNIFDLTDKKYMQRSFEKQVVANVPQQIAAKVDLLIDWMVERNFQQWHAMNEVLEESRQRLSAAPAARPNVGTFSYDRQRILAAVGQKTQEVVAGFDKEKQARLIAEQAQNTVAATAAMEAGAIGLGTLIAALASTAAADITGIVLASVMAVLGFLVIPARKRKAIKEMREKIGELRTQLVDALSEEFKAQIRLSIDEINAALSPYARFVRAEHGQLRATRTELRACQTKIETLMDQVEHL